MHIYIWASYCAVKASTLSLILGILSHVRWCELWTCSKFYGKCGFNSVPSRPSAFFSTNVVHFKIRNHSWDKSSSSVSSIKPSITSLAGWNVNSFQPVETKLSNSNPSNSYFIFYGKITLQPISYAVYMFATKMLVAEMLTVKILDTLPGQGPHTFPSAS